MLLLALSIKNVIIKMVKSCELKSGHVKCTVLIASKANCESFTQKFVSKSEILFPSRCWQLHLTCTRQLKFNKQKSTPWHF